MILYKYIESDFFWKPLLKIVTVREIVPKYLHVKNLATQI